MTIFCFRVLTLMHFRIEMSDTCLCKSSDRDFSLNSTSVWLREACKNENITGLEVVEDLARQDYEAIGNCLPPKLQNRYGVRMI